MDSDDELDRYIDNRVEILVKGSTMSKPSAVKPRKRTVDSDNEETEVSKPKKRGPKKGKPQHNDDDDDAVEAEGLDVVVEGGKRISLMGTHSKSDSKRRKTNKQHQQAVVEHEGEDVGNDSDDSEERNRFIEAGQIVTVYMENFMCHKKFTVTLGRRLNFISGLNGSGKSVIASALQVCFGSSARAAGRGPNMQGYIREGSPGPAIIRVTLVNEGPDAFQYAQYGKRITVERKIPNTGASTYQICNAAGEVISRSKKDIDAMLQMFNIYVNNPCNIMTQEESKKFLHTDGKDKYNFFLRATGLFHLQKDLQDIETNIADANADKAKESTRVAAKESSVVAIKAKLDKLIELETLGDKIKMCQIKAFWDDFRVATGAVLGIQEDIESKRSEYEKEKDKYDKVMRSESEKADEIEKFHAVTKEIGVEIIKVQDQITSRASAVQTATRLKRDIEATTTRVEDALKDFIKRKDNVEREINEIRKKAMQGSVGSERDLIAEIAGYDIQIQQLRNTENEAREQRSKVVSEQSEAESTSRREGITVQNIEREIRKQQEHIHSLMNGGGSDKAAAFDNRLPDFLRQMQGMTFRGRVVGPAGLHIKIIDGLCQPVEQAIEKGIGRFMFAFIVETDEDRVKLQQLMKRVGNLGNRFHIVQQPRHTGRYNNVRNPPVEVMTILRNVHIEHDMLYNAFIDQVGAESVAIVMTDPDVKALVQGVHGEESLRYGLKSVIVADKNLSTIQYRDGNISDTANRQKLLGILSGDSRSMIENAQRILEEKQVALQDAEQHRSGMRTSLQTLHSRRNELENTLTKVGIELRNLTRLKQAANDKLNDIQEAERADTTMQEAERDELETAIENTKGQFEGMKQEQAVANNALKDAVANKRELENQKERHMARLREQEEQINLIMTNNTNASKRIEVLQRVVGEKERELNRTEDTLKRALVNADEKRAVAAHKTKDQYPDWDGEDINLNENDTRQVLERKVKEMQAKISTSKRECGLQGDTVGGLTERYDRAKSDLDDLLKCLQRLEDNITSLTRSRNERQKKWTKALRRSTRIVKHRFDDYVKERGSAGTINFDHHGDGALDIEFQVDSSDANTVANDNKNLSGRERSFVTFCLQLALGHVIECPFRLLDEYDVYLDETSRSLTLQMMMRFADREDQRNRQFIILTPHHLRDVHASNSVRIIRMPDPIPPFAHGLQQQTLD